MSTLALALKSNARMAILICLWFLLASTGYLLWLHRVLELPGSTVGNLPVLAIGYLAQGCGIGIYLVVARGKSVNRSRRFVIGALCLYVVALLLVVCLSDFTSVFSMGCLANMLSGVFQGHYFMLLASRVDSSSRGTVFGCSYAASTFLTLLMSLPANGALSAGVPCLACCLLLSVAVLSLLRCEEAACRRTHEVTEDLPAVPAVEFGMQFNRPNQLLVGSTLLAACIVHAIGFSFPTDALASDVNLELSRVLYGIGIAVVGMAADRDRRVAFFACSASLVAPFLMLALMGAGATSSLLWALGYLLTGSYVLFSALVVIDLADNAKRADQAGAGMFIRYMGDAMGAMLCFAFSYARIALIAFASVAFLLAAALLITLYQRLFASQPEVLSEEQRKHGLIELFAARHGLTLRERDVLELVVTGKSNAEIAAELTVTERTVKFHMTNVLKKTGCKTRLDVIAQFAESGISDAAKEREHQR